MHFREKWLPESLCILIICYKFHMVCSDVDSGLFFLTFHWYAVFCFLDLVFSFLFAVLVIGSSQHDLNGSSRCWSQPLPGVELSGSSLCPLLHSCSSTLCLAAGWNFLEGNRETSSIPKSGFHKVAWFSLKGTKLFFICLLK